MAAPDREGLCLKLLAGPKPALARNLSGRDDNLNRILSMGAAAMLVSHAFPITSGNATIEPLLRETGIALGRHAVAVFFVFSGLLIARSYDRTASKVRFITVRVMSQFPGLAVVIALTISAVAVLTSLAQCFYLTNPVTYFYLPRNVSLYLLQMPLPVVFDNNPSCPAINGSL